MDYLVGFFQAKYLLVVLLTVIECGFILLRQNQRKF